MKTLSHIEVPEQQGPILEEVPAQNVENEGQEEPFNLYDFDFEISFNNEGTGGPQSMVIEDVPSSAARRSRSKEGELLSPKRTRASNLEVALAEVA